MLGFDLGITSKSKFLALALKLMASVLAVVFGTKRLGLDFGFELKA